MRDRNYRDIMGNKVVEKVSYDDTVKIVAAVLNHLAFRDTAQEGIVSMAIADTLRTECDWNDDEIQLFETFVKALQQ